MPYREASQLVKLNDELTEAMQQWSDLVDALKSLKWPSSDDLKDLVDSSAAWQDIHSQIEDLRDQAKEVERHARHVDEKIARLIGRWHDGDPEIAADDALVIFLSAAVPERRYELVYELQKLSTLTDRIRAEGNVEASPLWNTQLKKIKETAQRGFHDCEWQLDEITKTLDADRRDRTEPSPASASGSAASHESAFAREPEPELEHERREEEHEQAHEREGHAAPEHAVHEPEEGLFEEISKAAEEVARPAEEERGGLAGIAALASEAAEAASSGDSDARVEEDVLDGM